MAEFKLGRIKFVWKNAWTAATIYYIDDVIRYGGRTYICAVGHTSAADFNTDLEYNPTKWNQMSDGQAWKGDWAVSTFYVINDVVKYGGLLYICNDSHTSAATALSGASGAETVTGLEKDQAKWTLYAEGFDWKEDWTISTRYKKNDLVKYGGYTYVANAGHTSVATTASGLEADTAYWDEFNQGLEYKGTWGTVPSTRYKVNDVVKYGAGLWICAIQHTADASFLVDQSAARWTQFVEGIEFEDTWTYTTLYQPGDVVRYGGNQYVAKTVHTAVAVTETPVSQTTRWDLFAQGFKFQSDWVNTTSYKIGEVIRFDGYTYVASVDSPSNAYTVTSVTAATDRFSIGDTTGIVAGMTVRFTGTTFANVFTTARYYVKTVAAGYITISATSGGTTFDITADAAGSMTATISAEPPNASYWSRLNSGINWKGDWTDDTEYNIGNAVKFGSNAYICILQHRSEADDGSTVGAAGGGQANSRPDQDTTGTYWNVLSIGSETSLLTTQGDLAYYSGAGPSRLPIGIEGQVLRSNGSEPEWVSLGLIDQVYYVAPSGVDLPFPIHGGTLDKPWKTIRYACEQVEIGPRNPNAQYLLELNRAFIQREISAWIRYQITNNTAPFTTVFDYDEYKFERDVGFVVDRLIWDIGHGGNLKVRSIAVGFLGLYGAAGELSETVENDDYELNPAEADENIAAYEQLKLLIADVLANEAPAVKYQTLALDSTAIVDQYIDTDYPAETNIVSTTDSLIDIVITAITDQDIDNLPERIVPNTMINVKSGRYREVLPIIVPAETAVVGDETRSTNTGPAGSIISRADAKYSIGVLTRMETVVGQIILGTNVTETSGNTATQSAVVPFASSTEVTTVQRLIRTIQHQIDFKIGTTEMVSSADPTGYNTTFLSGYKDARTLLRENKEFIKEEITAYLTTNFSTVKYSRTKCKRDVGFIVDAMGYDLTYGGTWASLVAGTAYFDGDNSTVLQIDSTEIAATVAAYGRLKTVVQQIIANTTVTKSATNTATQWTDSTNLSGGSAANATVGALVDIITNIIQGDSTEGNTPQINVTTITGTNTFTSTAHGLAIGDAVIPRITANGLVNGTKYWVSAVATANTFSLSATYGGGTATIFTNGASLDIDLEVIDYPTATNAVTSTTALIAAAVTLDAAQETIVTAATAYIVANYPALVYNSAKCERDVRLILEAVMFDFMFNSNFKTREAAYSYLRASASDVYSLNQKTATRAAFTYVKGLAIANVGGDATAQARIETLMTTLDDIVFGATNDGSKCQTEIRAADHARLQLERNRAYIVSEITAYGTATYTTTVTAATAATDVFTCTSTSWMQRNAPIRFTGTIGGVTTTTTYYIQNVVSATTFKISTTQNSNTAFNIATDAAGSMAVSLYYSILACERDINSYLDALKFDIQYPGNYKSRFAARLYANAVTGSLEEDMYYLRNGTGIRQQTMEGLTGDLLAPNEYGTSRTSAGAYCSLDPGWGPDDYRTWIITRSPYVQNNTTIGYAAIGQKIDGALHNGGNRSIVSNDFTQLISDGIGAWVTNNGRAELVSVFTYYSHVGYLAEAGGRIRGTNGNNSYGDFGSVAEGFDVTEIEGTGVVDNTNFVAVVGQVNTDLSAEIFNFEFSHAGNGYTEATWTVAGAGFNADVEQDEFRDGAVFQVRLLDSVDDSTEAPEADGNFGGSGYISNANTAQSGTASTITIAATDQEVSAAYIGMKVYVTGGTGVGQFGIITSYSAGTKVAGVITETTGAAGWDHILPGTAISSPDASSTYVIEPRIQLTSPSYSSTARTLATSLTYVDVEYAKVIRTYETVSGTTSGVGVGATFNVTRKGTGYFQIDIVSAGTGYARLNTITILGTSLGGADTTNDLVITILAVNSTTGAVQAFDYTGQAAGGKFAAFSAGTRTVNTSVNGTTWIEVLNALPSTSTWVAAASTELTATETAGAFVTGRSYTILTLGDTTWAGIGAPAGFNIGTIFVATGPGTGTGTATPNATSMVAISSSTTVNAYSLDGGTTWASGGALPAGLSGVAVSIAAGDGRWVAIGTAGTTAFSINGGVSWTAGGALPAGTYASVAYGGGRWVAVGAAGVSAYSTNGGVLWTVGSGLASASWTSITWGNNRFVAVVGASGTAAAYSLDGVTWSASTITSATYTKVTYGQGVFLAVGTSTTASSSEDGIVWTSRTTSTAANGFSSVTFGNPNNTGSFVAVQRSTASTVATQINLGATTRARVGVASNKIFEIRIVEPGSGYTVAPTITITDPNNIFEAPTVVRIGNGVLANPSFVNRGTGFISANADISTGDGYADFFQSGSFIAMNRLTKFPTPGSNVVFSHLPDRTFKLVQVLSQLGSFPGSYTAFFQVAPDMTLFDAPPSGATITTRLRYSQVRLTGHDFLSIGTGSFEETNYPDGEPDNLASQLVETIDSNGGRVFYTSTDQDGNFRVGELFTIEQSTGVATLNADAFNIAGLQELTLGNITLGGGSASITEFSTDPFFTANSDSVVPTQRAIKAYITSQIGGGGAALNVNSVTAGFIYIAGNQISTSTGAVIEMRGTFDFRAGITGLPIAWNYFLN